ncbi:MAG TPA: C-GCAxxG-C-C family protein [Clostridia bacterium]|nr:C-GCAxxG-C-C family protein [Clostridia bacterium]
MAEGFFGELADQVGYPFNQIPVEAYVSAAGGYGQATLCGTIGTAAACIGTVCDVDTSKKLLAELSKWYKQEKFPNYQPEGLGLPQTVSESVLCEESVGKFMEVSGFEYGSAERKSRCAAVAAEVTRKMVELLNAELA